ncbi:MAG TPA: RHS repeat-associated core domain-containing protein [Candidatus Angelobacter sp.]|jgi:RHS repeat-associated protein
MGFSYDTVNRRSTLTLSNGVNMSYTYDNDSRVTGITYNFNANTMGGLSYTYDSLGRRTLVNGSFAQTGLPGAVTPATYDAANELTNWNGTAISYDLNGNMLSDGTNAFSWNARNQVATLNSVSLQYDAFGRRIQNAAGKSFLLDGANAVQELTGSTVLANLLNGGIDEIFTRVDSDGTFTQLKDALGSTIALADSTGNVQATYSYDPFGNSTASDTANGNTFQYTGRENEGNGLYYMRARYYSPVFHRFISEDPLGFAGSGANFYAYAFNSPTNLVDPFGLQAGTLVLGGGRILAGTEIGADVIGGAVAVGEAAPAVGAAGLVVWSAGRDIGHIHDPFSDGNTIDSNMQFLFTYFFFSQAAANSQAVPLTKAAEGGSGGGGNDPCKGFRNILQEHQDKLGRYASNPYVEDNLGILGRGYDGRIIAGRVKGLVHDILLYQKQLEECERKNGLR